MSSIKLFRENFGISQDNLAIYLGVARSTVSMAELGDYTLLAQKNIIDPFEEGWQTKARHLETEIRLILDRNLRAEDCKQMLEKISALIEKKNKVIERQKEELEQLELEFALSVKADLIIREVMETKGNESKATQDMGEFLLDIQTIRQRKNSPEKQAELRIQIYRNEGELEGLHKIRDEIKADQH
jgi:transcriptional regulator with XRE-family HTH domain